MRTNKLFLSFRRVRSQPKTEKRTFEVTKNQINSILRFVVVVPIPFPGSPSSRHQSVPKPVYPFDPRTLVPFAHPYDTHICDPSLRDVPSPSPSRRHVNRQVDLVSYLWLLTQLRTYGPNSVHLGRE